MALLDYTEENSSDVFPFLVQWFDNNDWVEVKTSGSTGEPKLIRLQKTNMIHSAMATGSYFDLFEKENVFTIIIHDLVLQGLNRALQMNLHK